MCSKIKLIHGRINFQFKFKFIFPTTNTKNKKEKKKLENITEKLFIPKENYFFSLTNKLKQKTMENNF